MQVKFEFRSVGPINSKSIASLQANLLYVLKVVIGRRVDETAPFTSFLKVFEQSLLKHDLFFLSFDLRLGFFWVGLHCRLRSKIYLRKTVRRGCQRFSCLGGA